MGDSKGNSSYADHYRNIDFRAHPEKYRVGRGEQGVLIAEPYKSEILPHWRFATPADAETSSKQIYSMFLDYKKQGDFVGMDMARKFLQMGFTRSRRYANHSSGDKVINMTAPERSGRRTPDRKHRTRPNRLGSLKRPTTRPAPMPIICA